MLNPKVQDALNAQINMEFSAYYTYLSMAAYFEAESLPGFAAWVHHHAQEEMMHAMKIYNYVNDRRGRVKLQALNGPKVEWSSALEAFEDALKHEQKVTASINKIVDLAIQEGDHATRSFLNWFVDEQVEEEQIVDAVIQDLKRIGDFGPGIYMLDRELATKQSDEGVEESEGE
jgi:ferritin